MSADLWDRCLQSLQDEFPAQQYNTWIRPLKASPESADGLVLLAPNRFVKDWVSDKYLNRIREIVNGVTGDISGKVSISIAGQNAGFSQRPVRPAPPPRPVRQPVNRFADSEPEPQPQPAPTVSFAVEPTQPAPPIIEEAPTQLAIDDSSFQPINPRNHSSG